MRSERKQFVTVCAVYASKLPPHAQYMLTKNKIIRDLLPHAQCTLAICYHMRIVCKQLAPACAVCASNLLQYAQAAVYANKANQMLIFANFDTVP